MPPASSPESPFATRHHHPHHRSPPPPASSAAAPAPGRNPQMPSLVSPKTPHQAHLDYRSSSPNYFGLVVDSGSSSVRSAGAQPVRPSKTPSSSSVHPNAAVSPHAVTLTSNSDYDDFKKQLELNRINLSRQAPFSRSSSSASGSSNRPVSQDGDLSVSVAKRRSNRTPPKIGTSESTSGEDLVVPRSPPKRGLSSDTVDSAARTRRQSPADFNDPGNARSLGSPPLRQHDRTGKTSFLHDAPPESSSILHRMSSVPSNTEPENPRMVLPVRIAESLKKERRDVLLLDMRVATQYAQARIDGALNLCIPTTLLKRPSYNVHRLADTFKDDGQKEEFGRWKRGRMIIVYDQASSQSAEAHSCVNILKKFASEGWAGQSLIIRGGFASFAREFPDMIDDSPLGRSRDHSDNTSKSVPLDLPPVMGGCPLPETQSAANPFFGNIRQNMDLIGGVGQIPVKCPALLNSQDREELPEWLRRASDVKNKGKQVADKFLHIEQREKTRMEEALSGEVVYDKSKLGVANQKQNKVKVAGIEKGTKNRYHNILPFEHSRVKLKGVPRDGCNYVNANFLETSLSSKRYIATQSPIPATFADFWNMVWQRDVRVVVMLTAETEGNQIKAHNYWNASKYGPIKLKQHSEHRASLEPQRVLRAKMRPHIREQRRFSTMMTPSAHDPAIKAEDLPSAANDEPYVVVRKFTMSHDSFPFERMREVTQLHFSAWPDFGVPTHPSHLLGLIEQCNAVVRASANGSQAGDRPVVVHCSAGCGRTGTFCTVDTVVDALKHHHHVDSDADHTDSMDIDKDDAPPEDKKTSEARMDLVEQAVSEFRQQRLSMVQSLDQFVMCYETVLEWIAEQKQPPMTA